MITKDIENKKFARRGLSLVFAALCYWGTDSLEQRY
jgi:hypothetical protein